MSYQFETRASSFFLFCLAVLFVGGLHAGALLFVLTENIVEQIDKVDESGMVFVDLSPVEVSAAYFEEADAVGPEAVETPEVPETPEEVELAKKVEEPVVSRTHYEPEDEELRFKVANPDQEESESENEADVPPTEVQDVRATEPTPAVEETTAPAEVEAERSERTTVREEGLSEEEVRAKLKRWQKKLAVQIQKAKRFPAKARKRNIRGIVTVVFEVDRYGRVVRKKVLKEDAHPILAEDALKWLERAEPLPPPPSEMRQEVFLFTMPFRYSF